MKKNIDDLTIWVLLIFCVYLIFAALGCSAEKKHPAPEAVKQLPFLSYEEAADFADAFVRRKFAIDVIKMKYPNRPAHDLTRVDELAVWVSGYYQEWRPSMDWVERKYSVLVSLDSQTEIISFPSWQIAGRPMPGAPGSSGIVKPFNH